jgi:hypothetical protein
MDVWEASAFFNYKGKKMRYWQNWTTGEKSWVMPGVEWWQRHWSEAHGRPYFINDSNTAAVWLLPLPAPRVAISSGDAVPEPMIQRV